MMNSFWNRFGLVLAATVVVVAKISSQGQAQNQPPAPPLSRAGEMLQAWNQIGNKLIAMAQDFPEDKYDFKVQKDERTFALNLLHAAALDFVLIRRISGSDLGPDFGEGDNPSRDQFKTKADIVKFVQEAVADGAKVIQEQGDTGLDKTTKFFGNRLAHNSYIWAVAIEHSAEHYGQLVVYYRANNLIPPDSRRNAQAPQPASGSIFRDCPDCPEMVVLPAGTFTMGSSGEEKSWAANHGGSMYAVSDEAPQHNVSLPSFALGKYDVTRGEYAAFARETGYPAGDGCGRGRAMSKYEKDPKSTWENPGFKQTDRDPVVCVTWQDAKAYVAWLNEKTGQAGAYRLPSESEWEYAARASTTGKFWWGDDVNGAPSHAWFRPNSGATACEGLFCEGGQTHPVGAKPANAFGLYDMAGNVWQWTEDCYDNSYAPAPADGRANETPSSDPQAKDGQGNCLRVDRGGSWMFPAWLLRPATRERNPADYRDAIMGFRVAKTLSPDPQTSHRDPSRQVSENSSAEADRAGVDRLHQQDVEATLSDKADATASKSESARKSSAAADSSASTLTSASQAFERGVEAKKSQGAIAAIPFFQRAIDLDQRFPNAFYQLGIIYRNLGQEKRAAELFKRAFETRARAKLPDRLAMAGIYYTFVTGEADKAIEVYRQWVKADSRNYKAVSNLGSAYGDFCQPAQAIEAFRRAAQLNPHDVIPQENLMELLTATGNFKEARKVFQEMQRANLDDDSQHLYMYPIAVLERDGAAMEKEVAWFADKPNLQHEILSEQADAEAYAGHLARARELSAQAVAAALRSDNKEQAAAWQVNAAWREELFGNETEARDQLARALATFSDSREINSMAAILFAQTGDAAKANVIATELEQQYSKHAAMQKYWLPCIRAQISLAHNDPDSALRELKKSSGYDLLIPQVLYYSHMPSILLRAEAYSALGRHKEAAEQWQKIINKLGSVQLSATAPASKLQLARAYALQARTNNSSVNSKARAAYEDFLAMWKDADDDIPILKQAQAEIAELRHNS